ncbi:MAG: thiamine phosphate synthase [Acidobacteria bacterium]|nr:thiamine phosphate synthase [Acidobacteriota bacterium]
MIKLDFVYPISHTNLEEKKLVRWAKSLLDCGATLIQYRDKNRSDKEIFKNCENLLKLFENYRATLVLNDRIDIAYILGIRAVHLGWDDIPCEKARELLGKKAIIGISTHNLNQAKKAINFAVNYIAIGPVFETNTKENAGSVVSEETQRKIIKLSHLPVVAIGGINLQNARDLYERGFSSLSAISVFAQEPGRTYKEFKKIFLTTKK